MLHLIQQLHKIPPIQQQKSVIEYKLCLKIYNSLNFNRWQITSFTPHFTMQHKLHNLVTSIVFVIWEHSSLGQDRGKSIGANVYGWIMETNK